MAEVLKLCINCKHIATSANGWENFRCLAPQNEQGVNMVTGSKLYAITFCKDHRTFNHSVTAPAFCGPDGKWWEMKPLPALVPTKIENGKVTPLRSTKGITADDL